MTSITTFTQKYHRPHNTQQARASPQQSSGARHAYIPSVTTALVREKDGLFITTSTSTLQLQRLDLPTR
eukprot:scaffold3367_cov82-Skeletonema_dohrnii-CCMP3373.AAC.5